jgi:ankyrin repeat protein
MKRSHSTAELHVIRALVPAPSDDPAPAVKLASDRPTPAPLAEPDAAQHVPMAFPGPFAYVPRPAAMQDGVAEPGSTSTASRVQYGLRKGARTPTFPVPAGSQSHTRSAPDAGGATTVAATTAITHATSDDANSRVFPPLILAAAKGRLGEVELLLKDPAQNIDQVNQKYGMTALIAASGRNKADVVACLLAAGAKVNLVWGAQGSSALITASARGHVEVVKLLIARKDIALDAIDASGHSALFIAATNNKPDVVACLLAKGAKVNLVCGEQRRTALMEAAYRGNVEVIKTLLKCEKIFLDKTDANSHSALFTAALRNAPDVVACLLAAGAKVNLVCGEQRRTALMEAVFCGHVEVVKTLLTCKKIVLDNTDANGRSALFTAVFKNAPDVVACLLEAGAKVNLQRGKQRRTVLMEAAIEGYVEVVKTLLTCEDIALTRTDANGRSALFLAAHNNKPDVVALLLAAGASVKIADAGGETATTIAISKKHAAVLELLVQHGAVLPYFQPINLAQSPSDVAFAVSVADFDPDQKFTVDAQDNPLGLAEPHILDDPVAFIDELLSGLESKQGFQRWLRAKGFSMACAVPVVECLSMLAGGWPVLAKSEEAFDTHKKRLVCAAALSRLSVLTAEGKALAHYTVAGFSAANVERLSAVAARQIEKLIAVSEQLLTTMGGDMLEKLIPDCLAATSLARQVDVENLSANLRSAGWITPLAQAIVTSWKAALATLESEPLAIPAGSTMRQITQSVFKNAERKAPLYFSHAIQRAMAAPMLLAALRTWIGEARSAEGLDLLFQIQCDQLRQYCEQIVSAG